jgi:hypothetical protein
VATDHATGKLESIHAVAPIHRESQAVAGLLRVASHSWIVIPKGIRQRQHGPSQQF